MSTFNDEGFQGLLNEFEAHEMTEAYEEETDEEAKLWLMKVQYHWANVLEVERIIRDELFGNWNEEQGNNEEPTMAELDDDDDEEDEDDEDCEDCEVVVTNRKVLSTQEDVMQQPEIFNCLTKDQTKTLSEKFDDLLPEDAINLVGLSILRVGILISDPSYEIATLTRILCVLHPKRFQDCITN